MTDQKIGKEWTLMRRGVHYWNEICGDNEKKKAALGDEIFFSVCVYRSLPNRTPEEIAIKKFQNLGELWEAGVKAMSDFYDQSKEEDKDRPLMVTHGENVWDLFNIWLNFNKLGVIIEHLQDLPMFIKTYNLVQEMYEANRVKGVRVLDGRGN